MDERRALIVGINHYKDPEDDLSCPVADAQAMRDRLQHHSDGTPNYECQLLIDGDARDSPVARRDLREAVEDLFARDYRGDALFYFSGHGWLTPSGGYFVTFDSEEFDRGVPMQEVVDLARNSRVRDLIIIVDMCHGGNVADPAVFNQNVGIDPLTVLRENMTVLASSHALQSSVEAGGQSLFTAAVIDALDGGAADHMGWVTAPGIYSYVERRFGAFDQRPVYKSSCSRVPLVRLCEPLIDRLKLRKLKEVFPTIDDRFQLDPEFEPEDELGNRHEPVVDSKVAMAQLLKEYRDAGLIKATVAGEQLFWTARRSHTVELTRRGREYWWLVDRQRI